MTNAQHRGPCQQVLVRNSGAIIGTARPCERSAVPGSAFCKQHSPHEQHRRERRTELGRQVNRAARLRDEAAAVSAVAMARYLNDTVGIDRLPEPLRRSVSELLKRVAAFDRAWSALEAAK